MININPSLEEAERFHRALPEEVQSYLKGRGIPPTTIVSALLGWNGSRITIPIFARDRADGKRQVLGFRLAKSPDDHTDVPKMLSSPGTGAELYGWETVALHPGRVVICEGEFDRLVLESRGFPAVTSTAGALTFKSEWVQALDAVKEIFICFDRDKAGEAGAKKVQELIPRARVVTLPDSLGEGGDVTDYFLQGASKLDFEILMSEAVAAAGTAKEREAPPEIAAVVFADQGLNLRARQLKRSIRLYEVVGEYLELRASGSRLVGHCPFHDDRNPSFTVYPDTDTYYCFGCEAHGDLVKFVADKENLGFNDALDWLEAFQRNKHHGDTN